MIDAEAARTGEPPSRIVERLFAAYLPEFVADSIRVTLRNAEIDPEENSR